jgi:hypothetical protein
VEIDPKTITRVSPPDNHSVSPDPSFRLSNGRRYRHWQTLTATTILAPKILSTTRNTGIPHHDHRRQTGMMMTTVNFRGLRPPENPDDDNHLPRNIDPQTAILLSETTNHRCMASAWLLHGLV